MLQRVATTKAQGQSCMAQSGAQIGAEERVTIARLVVHSKAEQSVHTVDLIRGKRF